MLSFLHIYIWFAVFPISLFCLIKGSDWFTGAAEKIGLMIGIPQFVVGVTVISIGTSLPELISSFIAVYNKSSEIVPGNMVGSNIANIFLIIGIGSIVGKKLVIKYNLIGVELPLLIGSALFTALVCWDGNISIGESILLVWGLIIFMLYMATASKKKSLASEEVGEKPKFQIKLVIIVFLSSGIIFLGAKYAIDSVINIARFFRVGNEIIAVTAVALGTSLPELSVTISAVKKKNAEMVVGNVLGSNIFNTFAVLGLPGLMGAITVPKSILDIGIPTLIAASLLFLVSTQDKQISRWEGFLFIIFYIFFLGKIIGIL